MGAPGLDSETWESNKPRVTEGAEAFRPRKSRQEKGAFRPGFMPQSARSWVPHVSILRRGRARSPQALLAIPQSARPWVPQVSILRRGRARSPQALLAILQSARSWVPHVSILRRGRARSRKRHCDTAIRTILGAPSSLGLAQPRTSPSSRREDDSPGCSAAQSWESIPNQSASPVGAEQPGDNSAGSYCHRFRLLLHLKGPAHRHRSHPAAEVVKWQTH